MSPVSPTNQTTAELVETFRVLALAKGAANLDGLIARYSRLYRQLEAIVAELKARNGDQRRKLAEFYRHPDPQVRLDAAMATLVIFPDDARATLQAIIDRREFPQAADAGQTLLYLKDGRFFPE